MTPIAPFVIKANDFTITIDHEAMVIKYAHHLYSFSQGVVPMHMTSTGAEITPGLEALAMPYSVELELKTVNLHLNR